MLLKLFERRWENHDVRIIVPVRNAPVAHVANEVPGKDYEWDFFASERVKNSLMN